MSDPSKSDASGKNGRAKPRATPVVVNPATATGATPSLGRNLMRSLVRKLTVFAVLIAVMAVWGAWQYSRRQAVESQSLGDYRIGGRAVTVMVVEPDVALEIGAGLRRDYTAQVARALAKRFEQLGYETREVAARSDEERFGQTTRVSDRHAAAQYQTQTMQAIRDANAPVLRVSLQDLKFDGHTVSEQNYRVELLDPQNLQPSWRATLTWREGRFQSIALLWNLRKNQLPPPLWDSLADLAIAQMRKDGMIAAGSTIH
ncbi:hypothetical protein [Lysobacter gummosus]|uniref:Transmembrane protein n=1 Tax=Lysobacter gummosus TaxID=262324 RepID=A0ABY3XFH6_9GAMM|nr:hypothetical protein [Lysobacter gummosus]ALN89779.1 hypothetical protein LG3211_0797 [Lysobacter gummosus]UNP30387.1 hypothetical protein MOV92_03665 [Lysobacter gummosus]